MIFDLHKECRTLIETYQQLERVREAQVAELERALEHYRKLDKIQTEQIALLEARLFK